MFGSFGWMELLLILFIVLIIFGAGKIPQLGEGLGKAIKGFKKSVQEPDDADGSDQTANDPTQLTHQDVHSSPIISPTPDSQNKGSPTAPQEPTRPQDFEQEQKTQ